MPANLNWRSFSSGIVSQELHSRGDIPRAANGVSNANNMIPLPHGPIQNRAGFERVAETKHKDKFTRLIPFVFSETESFVIELGENYARFHARGGQVVGASVPIIGTGPAGPNGHWLITFASIGGAPPFEIGKHIFLSGFNYTTEFNPKVNNKVYKVVNYSMNVNNTSTYYLETLDGLPFPVAYLESITNFGVGAQIVEVSLPYLEAQLRKVTYAQQSNTLYLACTGVLPWKISATNATNWTASQINYLSPTIPSTIPLTVVQSLSELVAGTGYRYKVSAVINGEEGFSSTPSGEILNNLALANRNNIITWTNPALDARDIYFNVYKETSNQSEIYAFIGNAYNTKFIDDNITPDTTRLLIDNVFKMYATAIAFPNPTPPPNYTVSYSSIFNPPSAVGIFQQRLFYGGFLNNDQEVWASRVGFPSNFSYSRAVQRDDDPFSFQPSVNYRSTVKHIVVHNDLFIFTGLGEIRVVALNSDSFTRKTISTKPFSNVGSNHIQPVNANVSILFVSGSGRLFDLGYSPTGSGYNVNDLTKFVPHLFAKRGGLLDLAFSRAPYPIAWAVKENGQLLSMTYVPEEQVSAWSKHNTFGAFESVASIPDDTGFALYATVVRSIPNRGLVRFVERMAEREPVNALDNCFVDCAARYSGPPTTTLSNLEYLGDTPLSIFADGVTFPPRPAINGQITFETPISKAVVGLAYEYNVTSLPVSSEQAPAQLRGSEKSTNSVYLRLKETGMVRAGPVVGDATVPRAGAYTERKARSLEPFGTPPTPATGEFELILPGDWAAESRVYVGGSDPTPMTLISMAIDVATND